jgi:riboflavin kinase / FMN adenylyltransferase
MKIFRGFGEVRGIRNPVVTTGSFDGVHVGHRTILNRLGMLAARNNGESVLITFDPHPRKVLYPDGVGRELRLINSMDEKVALLETTGLNNLIVVNFTREFSKTTSEEFVREYLCKILKARVIVVGFNHHFGFNKEGDYKQLWNWREKYGFEAEEIPEQEVQHETVSSTRIRKAISEGYIQRANAYLDHYYMIIGTPENRSMICTEAARFFRLPVIDENKILPATGVYAASARLGQLNCKAMVLITGINSKPSEVFVHFFENEQLFTGQTITLHFQKMVYGNINTDDSAFCRLIEASKEQIAELIY